MRRTSRRKPDFSRISRDHAGSAPSQQDNGYSAPPQESTLVPPPRQESYAPPPRQESYSPAPARDNGYGGGGGNSSNGSAPARRTSNRRSSSTKNTSHKGRFRGMDADMDMSDDQVCRARLLATTAIHLCGILRTPSLFCTVRRYVALWTPRTHSVLAPPLPAALCTAGLFCCSRARMTLQV